MVMSIVAGIVFLIILGILIYLRNTNQEKYKKYSSIAEITGILFAMWFSVFSIEQANSSLNETKDAMGKLQSISISTNKIAESSQSISKSAEITNMALHSTNKSIDTLTEKLRKLPVQLDSFYFAMNKLNVMMKSQADEYNRKPKIYFMPVGFIRTDSTISTRNFRIINDGDLDVKIKTVVFYVPKKNLLNTSLKGVKLNNETNYGYNLEYIMDKEVVLIQGEVTGLTFELKYKLDKKYIPCVTYSVFYYGNYKDGSGFCNGKIYIN